MATRFIVKDSYVFYRKARIEDAAVLGDGVDQGMIIPARPSGRNFVRADHEGCLRFKTNSPQGESVCRVLGPLISRNHFRRTGTTRSPASLRQFGRASAPTIPHRVDTMCRSAASADDGRRTARGASPTAYHDRLDYRPEVDGLRALAVMAVIVNHLHSAWLPSGYFGVDIFFVISGFVITQSLWTHRHPSFAEFFVGFVARRMRRLAPALLLCIAVTSVAVWLLVPTPKDSLQTGLFALFGVSNLFLYFQHVDYFTPSRDLNVFVHTWSLGVEEQFYLVFPAIFWLCGTRRRRGFVLGGVIAVLCAASLIASIAFARFDTQAVFYLMPFRFWELGAGVLLFLLTRRVETPMSGRVGATVPIAAAALLVAVLFLPPHRHVLVQVEIVILTMIAVATLRSSSVGMAVFGDRTIVFVGLMSYPLYLWHWSVISVARWTTLDQGWSKPLQLALMLLLSAVTYRYIERPLRYAAALKPNWRAIGVFVTASVCCAVTVAQFRHLKSMFGVPSAMVRVSSLFPPPFLPLAGSGLAFETTCVVDGSSHTLRENTFDLCTVPPVRREGQTIWTLGDSHAGHLQGLLLSLHQRTGVGVHLIEAPGVPFPMLPGQLFDPRQRIYERVAANLRPGDIVLLGRLYLDRDGDGLMDDLPQWAGELVRISAQLSARGVNVVVMGPPPMFHLNSLLACWAVESTWCDVDRVTAERRVDQVRQILRAATRQSTNIFLFDTFSAVCPPGTPACSPFRNRRALFRDKDHFNSLGAQALTGAFLSFLKANRLLTTE